MQHSATLLILDDDPTIRTLLVTALGKDPVRVVATGNLAEAKQKLGEKAVDILISDVRMPGVGELELLESDAFKHSGADCIVITGFSTPEIEIQALQRDVFDLIRKPFGIERIQASVSRCLHQRALKRENRELVERLKRLNQELEQTVGERTRELRDAYEELVAAKAAVERVEHLKTQFINIVSHEFNTPLNVIKGYLHLFFEDVFSKLSAEQAEALRTIDDEVNRVVELLREFLKIYTLENESFDFPKELLDVQALVQETVGKLGPFFTQRKQQFILNVPNDLPQIRANRRQLSIVIENLLVNAIRFTPDSGLITFSAQPRVMHNKLGVLFLTRDTGVGIPETEFERIFQRFYEIRDINRHTTGRIEFGSSGLGLGLAIARKIVEEHGGHIWVESAPDEGSKFYFFIPAGPSAPSEKYPRTTDSTVKMKVPESLRDPHSTPGSADDAEPVSDR